jgi:hypothetical protein
MKLTFSIPEFLSNSYFWIGAGAATLFWVILTYIILYVIGDCLADIFSSWYKR